MTVRNEKYYVKLYESYPDVVTLEQFRTMLDGIGYSTARKLLKENHVRHFYIRHTYMIPKVWVIEYVLSEHYAKYREELKV
ncbi:MAG: DNA-binding protein [Bacillota bacterium]